MIIGNPIMAGASGPAASIFVTGLSETDTVTATNGSKTLTGKWTQRPNPDYVVLTGYTQLEYIKSSGTQYIKSGVTANENLRFEADFTPHDNISTSGFGTIFCARATNQYTLNTYSNTPGGTFSYGERTNVNPEMTKDVRCQVSYMGTVFTSAKGTTTTISSVPSVGLELVLFARNIDGKINEFGTVSLYGIKLYSGQTLVRNFIPVKRNSDGAIGLYDLCGSTSSFDGTPFYGNSGTGTFTAGAEIPQTIDGFMIKPIRDFGTWTVTATDGSNTATQDVLVDVITNYEIEMSLSA